MAPKKQAGQDDNDILWKHTSVPPPTGYINVKNVTSTYGKSEDKSWWSLRPNAAEDDQQRAEKRRRLATAQEYAKSAPNLSPNRNKNSPMSVASLLNDSEKPAPPQIPNSLAPPVANGIAKTPEPIANGKAAAPATSPRTVVLHLGSRNLRLGFDTDVLPKVVPNCIARRLNKQPSPLPVEEPQSEATFTTKLELLKGMLRDRMRILKMRGTTGGAAQALQHNETAEPEELKEFMEPGDWDWTDLEEKAKDESKWRDAFFGKEAMQIHNLETSNWELRWPIWKGSFNTSAHKSTNRGPYTSSREIEADIEDILTHALETELELTRKDLYDCSVMLVLPDIYDISFVKVMCDLLMKVMGFKQICLQQESICASFAAGLSTTCIVDIGATKCTVSCVDEGYIVPESRLVLAFGGNDITDLLLRVLQKISFPYKEVSLGRWSDFAILEKLKEEACSLAEANFGVGLYSFHVYRPNKPTRKYWIRMYDEVIMAPMVLFSPRIVDFDTKLQLGPKLFADAESIDDVIELGGNTTTLAMRNTTKHLLAPRNPAVNLPVPGATANADTTSLDPSQSPSVQPEEQPTASTPLPTPAPTPAAPSPSPAPSNNTPALAPVVLAPPTSHVSLNNIDVRLESSRIPLDVAIFESICACGSEDRAKRMSPNIVLTGFGGKTAGMKFALETRLSTMISAKYPAIPGVTVITSPRETDPGVLAWKGLSTLSKIEGCNDFWVRASDWEMIGVRALRDRSFFF